MSNLQFARSRPAFLARSVAVTLAILTFSGGLFSNTVAADWKAGAAKVKITPARPMWMSGYASRTGPAEGTLIDLWAKALVLEDSRGERVVLISVDVVGIHHDVARAVCEALSAKHKLQRRQIAICSSHTHTGPVVGRTLMAMYFLDDLHRQLVADYTVDFEQQLVGVVGQAMERLAPVRVAWGNGHSSIAVNRRTNTEADVPRLRMQGALKGPVDHDVPVLSVRTPEGELTAVVFGYACHATVLSSMQWSGDYPGYAQLEIEKQHPKAIALFFAGCGADQNPLPRREVPIAEAYGKSLAASVEAVLNGAMHPVTGDLSTQYAEIPLTLDKLPAREELETQAKAKDKYIAQRAKMLLEQIDAGRPLSQTYPYPVQLWRLGTELNWVTLGGEVVVDYSIRLKRELGLDRTWVAGYTNDVMAYIPSLRVLKEGGYEGASSMIYYGLPTVWAPDVEEAIVKEIHVLVDRNDSRGGGQ
jgi:neutral ceramidase